MSSPVAAYSTPLLHVEDLERSITFYCEALGFHVVDTDGERPLGWARLHCHSGAIMLVRAGTRIDPMAQGILLYMYTPDLAGLRARIVATGIVASPIERPAYMPSGEVRLRDPDGYVILVAHWGEPEQRAWEARRAAGGSRDGSTA